MAAAKRNRDYAAERRRRNEEARRWGYSSLDALSKARRRGEFPSAAELRRDPGSGIRAVFRREDNDMQAFEEARLANIRPGEELNRTRENAAKHDRESAQWSKEHSQQKSTRFNKRWSAEKKERYYQTFVRPWGEVRSPEELDAYYTWQVDFGDMDRGRNPYVSD